MYYFFRYISSMQLLPEHIFTIRSEQDLNMLALRWFDFQQQHCQVYREFILTAGFKPPKHYRDIPFLPVEFFKSHAVKSFTGEPEIIFSSSTTTGTVPSLHMVQSANWYNRVCEESFRYAYGDPSEWCFMALLPSYMEREGSSLIWMMKELMQQSEHPCNGFFLNSGRQLLEAIHRQNQERFPAILIGVSYALLDLAEQYSMDLSSLIVMETGGMKGRRREMIREEMHGILRDAFHIPGVHSEYGMTELMSQAYSKGNGIFRCPPWMKILVSDPTDPLSLLPHGRSGRIHVIDLANYHSCAFIATGDIGRTFPDGSFEILGRLDHSDIRGCNLMI